MVKERLIEVADTLDTVMVRLQKAHMSTDLYADFKGELAFAQGFIAAIKESLLDLANSVPDKAIVLSLQEQEHVGEWLDDFAMRFPEGSSWKDVLESDGVANAGEFAAKIDKMVDVFIKAS